MAASSTSFYFCIPITYINPAYSDSETKYSDTQYKKIYKLLFEEDQPLDKSSFKQTTLCNAQTTLEKKEDRSPVVEAISYLYDKLIKSNPLYTYFAWQEQPKHEPAKNKPLKEKQNTLISTKPNLTHLSKQKLCFDCPDEILEHVDYKTNPSFLKISALYKTLQGKVKPLSNLTENMICFDFFTCENLIKNKRQFKLEVLKKIHPDNAFRYHLSQESSTYLKDLFAFATGYAALHSKP